MDMFQIVCFDELDDPSQITTLHHLSLNWHCAPEVLQEIRRNDDRFTPEFGLFAVNHEGTIMGGVLLMEIPTETHNGKLTVGGINATATKPGYQRRGVMTALITRCHEYFLEHQLDYSFLTTSRSLVAHAMYKKLGYNDLIIHKTAWKLSREPPLLHNKGTVVTSFKEENTLDVDKIFKAATESSYGFIYRPANFLKARADGKIVPLEKMRISRRNGKISGYAYWESSSKLNTCTEILTLDKSSFISLLADAEDRFQNEIIVIHCGGLSKREIEWLQSAHYMTEAETYVTVMVKSLHGPTKLRRIESLFGVNKSLFRMGIWDYT